MPSDQLTRSYSLTLKVPAYYSNSYNGRGIKQGCPELFLGFCTFLIVLVLILAGTAYNLKVFAATVTHLTVAETNMNISGQSALIVAFTAGASDAAGSIALNLGSAVSSVTSLPPIKYLLQLH